MATKVAISPNTMSASSTEPGDHQGGRAGGLPDGSRVCADVHGQHRSHGHADEEPETEQQRDRQLLAALRRGELQPEDARDGDEEEQDPRPAGEVATDVGAKRRTTNG